MVTQPITRCVIAFQFPEIKTFKGLYLQRNSFTAPDGAMEIAKNVVIPNDDVISRGRGFYDYFTVGSGSLNNLFVYEEKLLAIYEDKLRSYTDTGTSPNETGSENTISPDTGVTVSVNVAETRTSRSFQENGNFYFTTDNGVLKLSAFDGTIYKAGAPQGLDLKARLINGENSTWLAAGYIVGYRVVFGYQDENDNLILGAPSEIVTVNNALVEDQAWARTGAGPYTVTVTSVSHGLTTGEYLIFSDGTGGAPANYEGSYQITVLTVDTFSYSVVSDPGAASGTVSYGYAMPVRLEFSVPSEISTSLTWFYQIYRSSQQLSSVGIYSDFKLIEQINLTSTEISERVVFYDDSWPDDLRGAELYTNENSREGELQSNFRPPLCNDVTVFKGYSIYASCTTRQLIDWSVVDPTNLASADFIETSIGSELRRYIARTGMGNNTVRATCSSSSGLLITSTAHGFTNTGLWSVYIANQVGGSISDGVYYVLYVDVDTFRVASSVSDWIASTAVAYDSETELDVQGDFTSEATVVGSAWVRLTNVVTITSTAHGLSSSMKVYISNAAGGTLSSGLYTIVSTTTNDFTIASTGSDDPSGNTVDYNAYQPMFVLSEDASASVRLRDTAQGIIKAVDRDEASLIYAQYISTPSGVPGKMRFQSKGFVDPVYLRANTTLAGQAFSPVLPSSFSSGIQVFSRNDDQPHVFYSSKNEEPEAVPLVNFFPAGSKNATLLRAHALRDSMILLKEDGVWRVTGDNPGNFTITLLDGTVRCVGASSADVLNNQVVFLSNQGVCLVTENSVQIISRKIEEVIQPILGQTNIDTVSSGQAYETERLFLLTTSTPNDPTVTQNYCYNILTDAWSTWDDWLFTQAVIGPNDIMYYFLAADNKIMKERKNQTKIDYCGQNHSGSVVSVSADKKTLVVTITSGIPEEGDIVVFEDVLNYVTSVTIDGPVTYTLGFDLPTNLSALDSFILYEYFTAQIKLTPFHGGLVGRTKQFAEFQIHFRDESCTRLNISFSGQIFGDSELTDWKALNVQSGWGEFPWGFEAWGQQNSINLLSGTSPAPVCRILIGKFQQRSTFIQPIIQSKLAGEPLNIQAVSFAVRAYNERVSR